MLALGPDVMEQGRRAGRWLTGQGVRRLVELTGPRDDAGTADRSAGLGRGIAEGGLASITRVFTTDGSRQAGGVAVARALADGIAFDGVFAHSDELALGACDALKGRPGRKIVVAGVGGGPEAVAALKSGALGCLIRSPADLGPLLRSDMLRSLDDGGVSRRLVTSHDVLSR